MRFFTMKQDVALPCCITLRDFRITKASYIFKKKDYSSLNDTTVLFLSGAGDEARPDFIQHPVYMISEQLKSILEAYEDELLFRSVVLLHQDSGMQYRYHQILMDELDVKSDKTEYYPDRTEKRLILDSEKIGAHHLFMLANSRKKNPFVSLAVVESLLRRNVSGILFEEVEVD